MKPLKPGNDEVFFKWLLQECKKLEMDNVAELTGLQRQSIYRMLRAGSLPRWDSIRRICTALGYDITLTKTQKDN